MTDKTEWVMVPKEALGLVLDTAMAAHVSNGASSISMPGECVELAVILAGIAAAPTPPAQEAHPDDKAVDRFAAAMKAKLAQARAKGRSGWQDPAWTPAQISQALRQHVEKGDPCDVANYCMFLWARGARIEPVYTFPPDAAKQIAELESSYQLSIKSLRKYVESQSKIIGEITRKAQGKIAELEAELAEARKDAERWKWIRRKLCLTGNGDGTCSMHAINLPAANAGWPEVGRVAEFCEATIDAALAQSKEQS